MINAAELTKEDTVLEVGPGKGILTKALLEKVGLVIAIEKDPRWYELIQTEFASHTHFHPLLGDVLQPETYKDHISGPYKVVANIPYYLTSHLLRIFLEGKLIAQPTSMTLLVQHEVARRITAKPPEINMLALSVQVFGDAKYIQKVPKNLFKPVPKVDSAIIHIKNISHAFFEKYHVDEDLFFEKTKKAFAGKRKMLKNTLGIDSKKRPQELSKEEWVELLNSL